MSNIIILRFTQDMSNLLPNIIDCASEHIMTVQSVMRKLGSKKTLGPDLLQQFLDDEALYIKQIPKDELNVFRVIADATRFAQSEYLQVLDFYIAALKGNQWVTF